ncbi:hypothetical protein WN943_020721 [Citrus x changshan-huyou]
MVSLLVKYRNAFWNRPIVAENRETQNSESLVTVKGESKHKSTEKSGTITCGR